MRFFKGMTKCPWGFIETPNGLVATNTTAARYARAELGEFAVELLGKLGVSVEVLERIKSEQDPIAALQKIQQGGPT